jgi:tripartite-type tricarboxylate transporter receptor subunit TctC
MTTGKNGLRGCYLPRLALGAALTAVLSSGVAAQGPTQGKPLEQIAQAGAASKPSSLPPVPKAAGFPSRNGRLIINVAAGGSADIAARTLMPYFERELGGANFVIQNKPGAGQQVGLQELALARPDGYTIGLITLPAVATIYLDPRRKAAFNFNSFQALAQHVVDPIGIAVRGDAPYRSVKDLIAAARSNPGKLRAGSTGLLSANHLGLLQFEKKAEVKLATVQFDGGGAEALAGILGGNVDVSFTIVGSWVPHARSGKLRFLTIMDKDRSPFLPEIPTTDELGFKGVHSSSTRAFAAPKGISPNVAKVLEVALQRAILDPELIAKMEARNLSTRYLSAAEFTRYWKAQEDDIAQLMKLSAQ